MDQEKLAEIFYKSALVTQFFSHNSSPSPPPLSPPHPLSPPPPPPPSPPPPPPPPSPPPPPPPLPPSIHYWINSGSVSPKNVVLQIFRIKQKMFLPHRAQPSGTFLNEILNIFDLRFITKPGF